MTGGRRIVMKGDVALVGLGPQSEAAAAIDTPDLAFLLSLGCSTSWRLLPTGYVAASERSATGRSIGVARALLDAGPGTVVKHLDGDKLNLRRSNLVLIPGYSKRRDRDYLRFSKGI